MRLFLNTGLLVQKGSGNATFYVPTTKLLAQGISTEAPGISTEAPGITVLVPGIPEGFPALPEGLVRELQGIGKRTSVKKIREIIAQLCSFGPLQLPELVKILQRDSDHLRKRYLAKMINEKELEYLFPESPNHPGQAYRTKNKRI